VGAARPAGRIAGARGRRVYETGNPEHGIWWAGLTLGLIEDIPTVGELVARMVAEAEALISGRLALGRPPRPEMHNAPPHMMPAASDPAKEGT
jgi:hypothetical protein